ASGGFAGRSAAGMRLVRQKSLSQDSVDVRRQSSSAVMRKGQGKGGATAAAAAIGEDEKGGGGDDEDKYPLPPSSRMWALNKPEAGYLILGVVGAIMSGSLFPIEGVLIANMQSNLYSTNVDTLREVGEHWSLGFVGLAVVAVVGHCCMSYGFSVAGERLTRRLREIGFKAILRHDVGWFDREENSVGALTTQLEEDTSKVQFATGTNVAHKTQLTMTLLLGVLIGLVSAWQIGLLALALIPMMAAAAVVQMQMMNGSYGDSGGLDGGASAGVILGGALNGIATVTAFNMQDSTARSYDE
ncbi:unnamed protein product, partial [Laminaria digitata]